MTTTVDKMSQLARSLIKADEAVVAQDKELKAAKEHARVLREETIPGVMHELGIEQIKLDSGQKITIKQDVYASISYANKAQAYAWLEENGFGGLIKTEVSVNFAKGDLDKAQALGRELYEKGIKADLKQEVHAQTLKVFLRDELEKGTPVPLDLFGARPIWTTRVK